MISSFQALHALGSVGTMAFHDHFPGNRYYPVSSGISALASCPAWLCRVWAIFEQALSTCVVDSVAVWHILQLVSVMVICALLC